MGGAQHVEDATRTAVVRIAKAADRADVMPATQGNFSARDPRTGLVVITPHDYPYDLLTPDDLVVLDTSGAQVGGERQPSADATIHCTVYRERPGVGAVIHTEPPYVNAFGAVRRDIDIVTTTGLKSSGGSVPVMEFLPLRDEAFALEMLRVMGDRHAVIWANHGLLVVGDTLEQAYNRTLGVEFNARVLHLSLSLGRPRRLAGTISAARVTE